MNGLNAPLLKSKSFSYVLLWICNFSEREKNFWHWFGVTSASPYGLKLVKYNRSFITPYEVLSHVLKFPLAVYVVYSWVLGGAIFWFCCGQCALVVFLTYCVKFQYRVYTFSCWPSFLQWHRTVCPTFTLLFSSVLTACIWELAKWVLSSSRFEQVSIKHQSNYPGPV